MFDLPKPPTMACTFKISVAAPWTVGRWEGDQLTETREFASRHKARAYRAAMLATLGQGSASDQSERG